MRSHIGRLIWVLLTNGAFLFLSISGYSHEADLQRMLHPKQAASLLHLIAGDPWGAVALVVLAIGVVLEATWPKAAALVNCTYYVVALGAAICGMWKDKGLVPSEHITAALVFYTLPVFVIALVDIWLYRKDMPGFTPALQ